MVQPLPAKDEKLEDLWNTNMRPIEANRMKTYPIGKSATETIEFRANESTYALVHRLNNSEQDVYKTIILSKRELLMLYMAIQDEIQRRV